MGRLTAFALVLVACSRTTDASIDLAPTRGIGTDPTDDPGKGPDPLVVTVTGFDNGPSGPVITADHIRLTWEPGQR